jgi:arylsulfatase A-like enzyme
MTPAYARAMTPPPASDRPDNVVVVLLDSLNRHMLGAYGGTEFATPNLDRFAARSSRFTSHVTGSLPCMPARHDILVGALDFLWKPWGSIELWEESITAALRRAGVTTMLVSDHPHLFETGGENYHVDFSGWEYLRGHEGDPWRTYADPSAYGAPTSHSDGRPLVTNAADGGWFLRDQLGIADRSFGHRHYDDSRTWFRAEDDFPGPRTMAAARSWLRHASRSHDRWMLFVDEFDPHEPFDTPEPWASMYDAEPLTPEELEFGRLVWPPYLVGGVSKGAITERQARQIRNNYGAKLSMIDHHFGMLLDEIDAQDLWDTTAVIVCTDHGHYLGDTRSVGPQGDASAADIWGKPAIPQFEPLGHTPLMIHWPADHARGQTPGVIDGLTTNVDIHATIADIFGVEADHRTHGHSVLPLLTGAADSVREWAIGGVWGNWVQVTDGRRKYARAPVDANRPLSMWSNRWSTMPVHKGLEAYMRFPRPDRRATLDFMPGSDVPVIRQPFEPDDVVPFWSNGSRNTGRHHLYDLGVDPDESENRRGEPAEAEMIELLRTALVAVAAPDEQLARLGIE